MKSKIAIVLGVALLLTWVIASFSFYDDFQLSAALSRSIRNPTSESHIALDRQRDISKGKYWIFMGSVYLLIAGITVPLVVLYERRRLRRHQK
jgi:hypothetical protein